MLISNDDSYFYLTTNVVLRSNFNFNRQKIVQWQQYAIILYAVDRSCRLILDIIFRTPNFFVVDVNISEHFLNVHFIGRGRTSPTPIR